MSTSPERFSNTSLSTLHRVPGKHWPEHAERLYDHLAALYGEEDVLPTLAGDWIASQRSTNTQRSYARGLKVFVEFTRKHGIHPMAARIGLVGTFRLYLETAPTWRWIPGGQRARNGPPYSPNSRASTVCAANSFMGYLEKFGNEEGTHNGHGFADGSEPVP